MLWGAALWSVRPEALGLVALLPAAVHLLWQVAGLRPTHLDAHMAAAMLPELLDCHIALAREHGLVPVLPRHIGFAPDPRAYGEAVAKLEAEGLPLPDMIRGTLAVPAEATRLGYRQMIETLPTGITHVALHCAMPGASLEHAAARREFVEHSSSLKSRLR